MQAVNFEEVLERMVDKDPRFHREAYVLLREALDHTQKIVGKATKPEIRHVSGQELLEGIRDYLLSQYGPMAATLLDEWGVRSCQDFGEIVFNMVEHNILAKTDKDTKEDFSGGYDFFDAFRKPFQPQAKPATEPVDTSRN